MQYNFSKGITEVRVSSGTVLLELLKIHCLGEGHFTRAKFFLPWDLDCSYSWFLVSSQCPCFCNVLCSVLTWNLLSLHRSCTCVGAGSAATAEAPEDAWHWDREHQTSRDTGGLQQRVCRGQKSRLVTGWMQGQFFNFQKGYRWQLLTYSNLFMNGGTCI